MPEDRDIFCINPRHEHRMDDERHQSAPAKKDRKHWCRGKPGVEHVPVCRSYIEVKRPGWNAPAAWRILVCSECGKELAHYYPFSWRGEKIPVPEWVAC